MTKLNILFLNLYEFYFRNIELLGNNRTTFIVNICWQIKQFWQNGRLSS